ncbi:unnamed protein product [Rotaria sp. Silwood2]|nr:unnamed protein product [Rotaria sp. Silwood2]CAF2518435.1 unnamed protein product [Rotaria sp. Silwood2]CAF2755727.1 unnamed protein product [Rotaria sp. Silwood2]CAF2915423.1 unnamed protein product [Rotaria sp. Silwood2]CAF3906454.1 unnamed protein product [Rotaria sp. Silwood2]
MPIARPSHITTSTTEETHDQDKTFYRLFIQFLASNLGLTIFVVAYSIGGTFLFILLEQYIELQNLDEDISIANLSETMYNYVVVSTDNTTIIYEQIVDYLNNFTNDIYDRKNNLRYTGQDCSTTSGWTFPSALLFVITIITGIGFGHITPVSWEGQITCICYALTGIPIFLICLAKISSILSDIFRLMYSTFIHCVCCCCRIHTRSQNRSIHSEKSFNPYKIDYVGTTSVDPSWPEVYDQFNKDQLSNYKDGSDEEIDDVWNRIESQVPILVIILIIIGYICLGAFMCHQFESWTITESVYFCYITLSTIGFGDYVPGITSGSTDSLRFLATSLYIIVGLAVLAMCFDLIKENIFEKFEWIAIKLGAVFEDDKQINKDDTHYANFKYSQQEKMNKNHLNEQCEFYDALPDYDYFSSNGQWFSDIKDKIEPMNEFLK